MNKKITAVLVSSVVAAVILVMAGQAYALDLSGSAESRAQEYVSASVSANSNGNGETSTNVVTTTLGTASASASAAAELSLNKPMPIMATSDLITYDARVIKARPVVTAINFQDNNIAIEYSQPAKLFGIFPSSILGQVVVDAKGNAAIEMPWWAMFYAKDTAGLQASIESAVAQSGASFGGQTDVQVQLQNKARIIDAVTAALQAEAVASSSVSMR